MADHFPPPLTAIMETSFNAIFALYGIEGIKFENGTVDPTKLAAHMRLQFRSNEISGHLALCCNRLFGDETWPIATTSQSKPSDAAICDWIKEIANQVVGRIGTQLRRYGTQIDFKTPEVVERGAFLAPHSPSSLSYLSTLSIKDTRILQVFSSAEIAKGFAFELKELEEDPDESSDGIFLYR